MTEFSISTSDSSPQNKLIAIGILILPEPKMLMEAACWNAKMRKGYPEGFELDIEHTPHITMAQYFVSESDLPKVLDAVNKVKTNFDLHSFEMTATGLYHIPSGTIGLASIVIEPTTQLLKLQRAITEVVNIYACTGGGESAFVPDKSGTPFDPLLFKYVETFASAQTNEHFNPHITVGIAPRNWLEEIEKKSFNNFTFGASRIATFQLGNFGAASKQLDLSD